MRVKKYVLPIVVIVVIAGIIAAVFFWKQEKDTSINANEVEPVNLLLSSDEVDSQNELEGVYTSWRGIWDVYTGDVAVDKENEIVTTGPDRQMNLLSWDGGEKYIVWDESCVSTEEDNIDLVNCKPFYLDGTRTIWGPGYQVKLTNNYHCIVTREGEKDVTFTNIDKSLSISNLTMKDLEILGCDLVDNQLTLVYAHFVGSHVEGNLLLAATLNLDTQVISWTDPVEVLSEDSGGMFFSTFPYYPIVDGKMYFSTWESFAYFDIENGTYTHLDSVDEMIKTILPDAERTAFFGETLSSDVMGSNGELVIGLVSYKEKETNMAHDVYFAIQGKQILGIADWCNSDDGSMIITYDKNLQQLKQVSLPKVNVAPKPQTLVSPIPF